MTEYLNKSFSVYPGGTGGQEYRDNWDRIFGKKKSAWCVTPSGRTDCHGFYQETPGICDFCGEPVQPEPEEA
jgi:hypothetical protein